MEEHFKIIKTYQKGGSPKLIIDWVEVPRKVRIKLVKEVLPDEFIKKMEYLGLTDEVFNGHDYIPNEITYKKRLEHYVKLYPTFEEFIFESCHWKNVRYNVNYDKEQETKDLYKNDFQYIYYTIFGEIFSVQSYEIWSNKLENQNKFLSDFVREIKFGKNKYKPKDKFETITDIDGNVYQTVQIGNQVWMAENLRVSRFRNSEMIPNVQSIKEWQELKAANWLNYENDFENDSKFGKLYNWYAVIDDRHIAPEGWHISTYEEWRELENYLIENDFFDLEDYDNWFSLQSNRDYRSDNIAKSLAGKSYWKFRDSKGTIGNDLSKNNSSGFNALPSGSALYGKFKDVGLAAYWWSSNRNTLSYGRYIGFGVTLLENIQSCSNENHYAIRCVKNK
jgi:uncharacterized protein (TIGR02145 family)